MPTTKTNLLKVFLHTWQDINPEQYRAHVSAEREGSGWGNDPKTLAAPDGWTLAEANDGSTQLYDDKGRHVEFCGVAGHRKSVEVAGLFGTRWLSLSDAEEGEVCCPTCGHPV